jgi:hypothetical protein
LYRLQTKAILSLPWEPFLTNNDFPTLLDSDMISVDSFVHVALFCLIPPGTTGYLEGSSRAIVPPNPRTFSVSWKRSNIACLVLLHSTRNNRISGGIKSGDRSSQPTDFFSQLKKI